VVPGRICIENSNQLPSPGIIERNWKAPDMKRPLTARTLVQTIENILPVRLLNVDTEPKVVYRNSEIGQYLETETIASAVTENSKESDDRSDLQVLQQESIEHLSKRQGKEVATFLTKYKSLFAKGNNDLGKTNLVKHKINTGDARPIKQPVRRTPIHLSQAIDKTLMRCLTTISSSLQ
jgi:hypothetical protein